MIDPSTRETPPPGVYRGVPMPHYRGWKAVNASRLKVLADKSPAQLQHENEQPDSATAAQAFGTLGHTVVLQPQLVEDLYAIHPPGHKNSNAYKAAKQALLSARPFVTLVEKEELERANRADKVIRSHSLAAAAFGGETEVSIVWLDSETGLLCKARIDSLVEGVGLWDLKFTSDLSDVGIERVVGSFRYDLQAAFYLRGVTELGLDVPPEFGFGFVEDSGIHEIRMEEVPGQVLVSAEMEIDELLGIWKRCEEKGEWPRRPETVGQLPVPYWLQKRAEERVTSLEMIG